MRLCSTAGPRGTATPNASSWRAKAWPPRSAARVALQFAAKARNRPLPNALVSPPCRFGTSVHQTRVRLVWSYGTVNRSGVSLWDSVGQPAVPSNGGAVRRQVGRSLGQPGGRTIDRPEAPTERLGVRAVGGWSKGRPDGRPGGRTDRAGGLSGGRSGGRAVKKSGGRPGVKKAVESENQTPLAFWLAPIRVMSMQLLSHEVKQSCMERLGDGGSVSAAITSEISTTMERERRIHDRARMLLQGRQCSLSGSCRS